MIENAHSQLATSLHFTPLIAEGYMLALSVIGITLLALSALYHKRTAPLRALVFALFMLVLINPSLLQQERHYTKDVAVILVDQSASQEFGEREKRTNEALSYLEEKLLKDDAFELRIIRAPTTGSLSNRTDLFSALDQAFADVPAKRRAGVIILSDGQIHDIPDHITRDKYGPVHLLLTGNRNERDRRIAVTNASAYGLVGKTISLSYKVEDTDNINQSEAHVTLRLGDGSQKNFFVPVNEEQHVDVPITNVGQNMFTLWVDGVSDEITQTNNRTALLVNGVRDRLKVLLISGIPHSGERMWRDLLTSDPGVDLVHFTILREPQKLDFTPRDELSLIAFPFDELFNIKLYDFDLIVFDQYRVNNILPSRYFENIARYVRKGGAFLSANGPTFAGKHSIYDTALGDILPGSPTGNVREERFKPTVTMLGERHPVTKNLIWNNGKEDWGDWLRSIDIKPQHGDVLMSAGNDSSKPMLILDRVEKGRVAQLSSDQIWLWSRGFDGGGPHAELLRRIVHWLMKEPELDERSFDVRVNKDQIMIEKQNYARKNEETLSMLRPDGETQLITLKDNGTGLLLYKETAKSLGVYTVEDVNGLRKTALIGSLNPPELRAVITDSTLMMPIVKACKGKIIWLSDTPHPSRLTLRHNNDYTLVHVKDISLLPEWGSLLILLLVLLLLWWREGQRHLSKTHTKATV